jgi:hypothetical protein
MSFEPREYLRHMLAEAEYLLAHSQDLDGAAFLTDETLQRAFVRSLEIIGEAAKKVPELAQHLQHILTDEKQLQPQQLCPTSCRSGRVRIHVFRTWPVQAQRARA